MKKLLDKTNLKIMGLLQENCKISIKELAEKLNLSTTPVFERVKRLEKEGYIEKYTALINERKIGLKQTIFIGISLKGHTRSYLKKFSNQIQKFPEIVEAYQVAGNFDFLLKIVLEDIDAYEKFVQTKLSLISDIRKVHSYIAIRKEKYTTELDLSRILI